jgi:hypothetical protein
MPDSFEFDLKTLVRVCLNDPTAREEVEAALAEGAAPVRESFVKVKEDDRIFVARLRTDRDKEPGTAGFLPRERGGWIAAVLTEAIASEHDASTMSQEQYAKQLGISVEELAERLKPNI